ncbi:hypothetical protein ACFLU6_02620 [Acidobacteriota bacterium]
MSADDKIELLGFNSDILLKGKTFHVQTEIFAVPRPSTIRTSVYHRGYLIKKISFDCSDLMNAPDAEERLKEKVKKQHFQAVSALKDGAFPVDD